MSNRSRVGQASEATATIPCPTARKPRTVNVIVARLTRPFRPGRIPAPKVVRDAFGTPHASSSQADTVYDRLGPTHIMDQPQVVDVAVDMMVGHDAFAGCPTQLLCMRRVVEKAQDRIR